MRPMSRTASIPHLLSYYYKERQEKGVLDACPIPSSPDLTDLTPGMGISSNVQ